MKLIRILPAILIIQNFAIGGQTVPDFRLKDSFNNSKQFSDLRGQKLTIVDFWATWCSPCIKAIPKLNILNRQFSDKGVQFIGINTDSPRNDSKILPFIKAHKIEYPVLKDPNGSVTSRLNIHNIPVLLIVDENNDIVFRHQGYRPGDEKLIEAEINRWLSENAK